MKERRKGGGGQSTDGATRTTHSLNLRHMNTIIQLRKKMIIHKNILYSSQIKHISFQICIYASFSYTSARLRSNMVLADIELVERRSPAGGVLSLKPQDVWEDTISPCGRFWRLMSAWEICVVVILYVYAIAGNMYFYIYRETGNRPFIWIHLLMVFIALLSMALFIFHGMRVAQCFRKPNKTCKNKLNDSKSQSTGLWHDLKRKVIHPCFDLNGEYFLLRMFFTEHLEIIYQFYTYFSVYACTLPPWVLGTVASVMLLYVACCQWTMKNMESSTARDRQMLMDVFIDVFCMTTPMTCMYFIYYLPVTPLNTHLLINVPLVALLLKMYDLGVDTINVARKKYEEEVEAGKEHRVSRRMSITRESMRQAHNVPRWIVVVFSSLNAIYSLCWISIMALLAFAQPSPETCYEEIGMQIWEGCHVHVPFCSRPFAPQCNCAIMTLVQYNESKLPDSFAKLDGLAKLRIIFGSLEKLDDNFGFNHHRLVHLEIVNQKLKALPDSVFASKHLFRLELSNNQLSAIPSSIEHAIELFYLGAEQNNLTEFPIVATMPQMVHLFLGRNQIKTLPSNIDALLPIAQQLVLAFNTIETLPQSLGKMSSLKVLLLHQNRISRLPESMCDLSKLGQLFAWNNSLTVVPSCMDKTNIDFFDIRNNKIKAFEPSVLVRAKGMTYFSAAGNPICTANPASFCGGTCSANCPSVWRADGCCSDGIYLACNYNNIGKSFPKLKIKPEVLMQLRNENTECFTEECNYDDSDCFFK